MSLQETQIKMALLGTSAALATYYTVKKAARGDVIYMGLLAAGLLVLNVIGKENRPRENFVQEVRGFFGLATLTDELSNVGKNICTGLKLIVNTALGQQ